MNAIRTDALPNASTTQTPSVTSSRALTIALVGNPNSGKTTLFNKITGKALRTGNRAGVTVNNRAAQAKPDKNITVVDTPGVNALSPYSPEERHTANFLANTPPDAVINALDCTRAERGLYLTSQLLQTPVPTVIALTMTDTADRNDVARLQKSLADALKVPCVAIDDEQSIRRLFAECRAVASSNARDEKFFAQNHATADRADVPRPTNRSERPTSNRSVKPRKTNFVAKLPPTNDFSPDAAVSRRKTVAELAAKLPRCESNLRQKTKKIDGVFLHRLFALPIFLFVMSAIFFLSSRGPCKMLCDIVAERLTPAIQDGIRRLLLPLSVPAITSLLADGVTSGVMSVVGFLPQIAVLSALMAALEESGYMARIALIADLPLSAIGLCGQSSVCLTLGCGCSVTAIGAAGTVKCDKMRCSTVSVVPYVPCSAKLTVIACMSAKFFDSALVAVSLYAVCLAAAALCGLLLDKFGKSTGFSAEIVELPYYRLPQPSVVGKQTLLSVGNFLKKAGTAIVATSVLLWFAQRFDFSLRQATVADSICGSIGNFLSPLFAPLGFDDRGNGAAYAVATLTGITAKEAAIATLTVLGNGSLPEISPLGAYCWTLYNLLTVPCVATVAASVAEQGRKNALKAFCLQVLIAYIFTLFARITGKLIQYF